jgi:hypothetical protein
MEEIKENSRNWLEDIGKITDVIEKTFISENCKIVVELPEKKFRTFQKNFREIDGKSNEIVVEVSDVIFTFVLKK